MATAKEENAKIIEERLKDLREGKSAIFTVNAEFNQKGSDMEYYENDFFEPPATDILEGDSLEQGAPGQYDFEELRTLMVNVTEDGLVKKRLTRSGTGQNIMKGSLVEIHYNGFWNGENISFDSSYLRTEPKKFIIGECEVLPGIEEAVKTMVQGEEAQFLVSYKLLFGERGCPPRIKPKADALFNIEVLRVIEHYDATFPGKKHDDIPVFEEAYKCAKSLHANGVESFKMMHIRTASSYFDQAVSVLLAQKNVKLNKEDTDLKNLLLQKLYVNLMVCHNKENKPRKTCSLYADMTNICDISKQPKALYLHGGALQKMGDYEEALEQLRKAYSLKPGDVDIKTKINELKKIIGGRLDTEKKMCGKIFGLKVQDDKVETPKESETKEIPKIAKSCQKDVRNISQRFDKDAPKVSRGEKQLSKASQYYEKPKSAQYPRKQTPKTYPVEKQQITKNSQHVEKQTKVSKKFEDEMNTTIGYLQSSEMIRLKLDFKLTAEEIAYIELKTKGTKIKLEKEVPKNYVLVKMD